jgi:nitrite reductase (NO-forming)
MKAGKRIDRWLGMFFVLMAGLLTTARAVEDEAPLPAAGTPHSESLEPSPEGRVVFLRCQSCHSLTPGRNGFGPSLAGLIGRRAGSIPKFNYSDAMRQSQIVWSAENLERYLADPQAAVPGNRMSFPGVSSPTDRANLIEFLIKATAVERHDSR